MATFFTCVFLIALVSLVTVSHLGTKKEEFGITFLGAFVAYSIIVAIAQAISFVISFMAMFIFDFKPDSIMDLILVIFWFACLAVICVEAIKRVTK